MKTTQIQFRVNPKNKDRCLPNDLALFEWSLWAESTQPKLDLAYARKSERTRCRNLGRKVLFEFRIKP